MARPFDYRERAFLFACEIVKFAREVAKHGPIMTRLAWQLVDAGTSVGSNLEESADGQTKPDFIAKQFVSLKEARETVYWLRLIAASEPPLERAAKPLLGEATEFVRMLRASVKRARSNPHRGNRDA